MGIELIVEKYKKIYPDILYVVTERSDSLNIKLDYYV
ncbi:hypothetical protein G3A_16920 [Bacillus sp. 17376]|nr:hypothetical protein G3A_16920 [Bacillus sp. 17376]